MLMYYYYIRVTFVRERCSYIANIVGCSSFRTIPFLRIVTTSKRNVSIEKLEKQIDNYYGKKEGGGIVFIYTSPRITRVLCS